MNLCKVCKMLIWYIYVLKIINNIASTNTSIPSHNYHLWAFYFLIMPDFCGSDYQLHKISDSGHPCFIPDLRGRAVNLSQWVWHRFVICGLYYFGVCSFCNQLVEGFCPKKGDAFSQMLFSHYWDNLIYRSFMDDLLFSC